MKGLLALILVLTGGFAGANTTFEHGVHYTANSYGGHVHVYCGTQYSFQYCGAVDLDPAPYTRLVSGADADRFELEALHEDGTVVTKDGRFSARRGNSAEINLGIRTLLQRPLLAMGENLIRYRLLKKRNVVEQGEFTVTVAEGVDQACPSGTLWLSPQSCASQSYVCNEYLNRYCQ